ncbi:Creatinase/aminopeptidase [Dacryopinax primogenitus]|uniref:Creatinase/aminopeptidase n=1 Tax=Dacryopinax primogenitus (strain DJM 731) TaxID=1858805 RepID=M5FQS2_DACPD|nr:Creatinase/aminopeptidase [Dacryopinax primogenitus]EJT99300.1 Creatinase/aminopeptidase [Dacryopinax primogenitus]
MVQTKSKTVPTTERLKALREFMRRPECNVQAYVIPSEDQHASEYLADCDARRAWISGFSGSAGCAVVTLDNAHLFTDGRYFLQAEQQLDSNWQLMKQGLKGVPTWQKFLSENLPKGTKVGIDSTLISAEDARVLKEDLGKKDSSLVPVSWNIVDRIWLDRPARPKNPIIAHELEYAGKSSTEKIKEIREYLVKNNFSSIVVSMLDDVAWLFNLRGSDIAYNPVFFAYALITDKAAILFVDPAQLTEEVRKYLGSEINIQPYDCFWSHLAEHKSTLSVNPEKKILISRTTSWAIARALEEQRVAVGRSPVADLKAVKNEVEIEGFRQSNIRDGAALVRYFAWLEEQLHQHKTLSETDAADQLEKYRSEMELFMGLSFPTISATGSNGAIIHYQPDRNDCATIELDSLYLCDSGAQYKDGTTDTTRTWAFGIPKEEEIRAFTRVLQGHMAIDMAVFPEETSVDIRDAFARRPLWIDGLDYRHGTGHGVGSFLNVHEGPHGIGQRIVLNDTALKAGMVVSDEPGYYADGRFGIRIENVIIVRKADTPNRFGDRDYYTFEHVTMCPIQTSLVDVSLLTKAEKVWLNEYHTEIEQKLLPLLEAKHDERAITWLKRQCAAV